MAEVPMPFAELLDGYGTTSIGEGLAVESVIALLKLRTEQGTATWAVRSGGAPLPKEELLGTLDGITTSIRKKLAGGWRGENTANPSGTPLPPTSFSDLFAGLETVGIVDEHLIESIFAIIKARRAGGTTSWFVRSAEMKLSSEEVVGALEGYLDTVRQDVAGSWTW
jgi:hypothetical protein